MKGLRKCLDQFTVECELGLWNTCGPQVPRHVLVEPCSEWQFLSLLCGPGAKVEEEPVVWEASDS